MPQRREHPYIWATWLPRLLNRRELSCEWAIWLTRRELLRVGPSMVQQPIRRPPWTRQPSDFHDQAEWLMRHTALLGL